MRKQTVATQGAPAKTSFRAAAALAWASVVVVLGAAELAVRAVSHEPPKPRITEPATSPFARTPQGLLVYKPGASFSHIYDLMADPRGYYAESQGRVTYQLNNLGFRDRNIYLPQTSGMRRILCLGDSFTFGEGVRVEDAWPQQLGRLLGDATQVINAGVQGYGFAQEFQYLSQYRHQLKPDIVVLGFFMNDVMPFEETVSHFALLVEAPNVQSWPSRVSALWRFIAGRQTATRQTALYLKELRDSFSSPLWTDARGKMRELRQMADDGGFEIVVMIFPLLYRLDNYPLTRELGEVRSAFAEVGIKVIDLLDVYRGHEAEDLWAHISDPHPNEIAHAMAAEQIAQLLKSRSDSAEPRELAIGGTDEIRKTLRQRNTKRATARGNRTLRPIEHLRAPLIVR